MAPGDCLKACNGSDVQLAQGASARPNLAKGRGRYLFILPGRTKDAPAKQDVDNLDNGKEEPESSESDTR